MSVINTNQLKSALERLCLVVPKRATLPVLTFAIWDHNLTSEEASRELDRVRRKGLPAFAVEQRSRHKAEEAEDCGDCPADVEHAMEAIPSYSKAEPGSPNRQV
jgi:hypothetical protein